MWGEEPTTPERERASSIFFNDSAIDEAGSTRGGRGDHSYPEPQHQQDPRYDDRYNDRYEDRYNDRYDDSSYPDQANYANGPRYDDEYYEETPHRSRRPEVLASTAAEWDYETRDDYVVESSGPNKFLVFALAALCAALVGVGFAIYSVLSGGGDATNEEEAGSLGGASVDSEAVVTTTTLPTTTTTLFDPATMLNVSLSSEQFVCDDQAREFGSISGANPGESVAFSSPQSSGLSPGTADETGYLPIRWRCSADQVGTVWELTATGVDSKKTGSAVFTGVAPGTESNTETADGATTVTGAEAAVGTLRVDTYENPFTCDNGVRGFARITGATPNAEITFSSPDASGLRPGTADAEGKLDVRWSCSAAQAGTTWNLTATEAETNRSVEFSVTGSAAG